MVYAYKLAFSKTRCPMHRILIVVFSIVLFLGSGRAGAAVVFSGTGRDLSLDSSVVFEKETSMLIADKQLLLRVRRVGEGEGEK